MKPRIILDHLIIVLFLWERCHRVYRFEGLQCEMPVF